MAQGDGGEAWQVLWSSAAGFTAEGWLQKGAKVHQCVVAVGHWRVSGSSFRVTVTTAKQQKVSQKKIIRTDSGQLFQS